jgi:hypothetical protein
MDRDLLHPQFERCFIPGVSHDDHVALIDHDRLPEAKLLDRLGYGIHGGVIDSRVIFIGLDLGDVAHLDFHGNGIQQVRLFRKNNRASQRKRPCGGVALHGLKFVGWCHQR